MQCDYFERGSCRSCTHLTVPYPEQLRRKQESVARLLQDHVPSAAWLPAHASAETGFRTKAKLAVGGSLQHPTLGLTGPDGTGIDLRECRIHHPAIWEVIPDLAGFITYAGLTPYDVARRSGALKFILVTTNARDELLVRFVLRDESFVATLRAALPALLTRLPQIVAVSANIHPEHKAVVEGAREIALTQQQILPFAVGDVTLNLRHRSFVQTNSDVAAALYRQVATWADACSCTRALDLYCGVGGFALHLAGAHGDGRQVHGIEIEPSAVASARASAAAMGVGDRVSFEVGDARGWDASGDAPPDLVVVNPPRRGIGADLAATLERIAPGHVVYSSCNPTTLRQDLAALPSYTATSARLFDMFAHTDHAEVALLLTRTSPDPAGR